MNKDKNSIVSPRGIPPVVDATSQQPINNPTQENQLHYLPQYGYQYTLPLPQYVPQYDYTHQLPQYAPSYGYQYVQQLPYYVYDKYVADTTADKNSSPQDQQLM
jgi:hypothetical protein